MFSAIQYVAKVLIVCENRFERNLFIGFYEICRFSLKNNITMITGTFLTFFKILNIKWNKIHGAIIFVPELISHFVIKLVPEQILQRWNIFSVI